MTRVIGTTSLGALLRDERATYDPAPPTQTNQRPEHVASATSPLGGWLVEWVGVKVVVAVGGLLGAAGVAALTALPAAAKIVPTSE